MADEAAQITVISYGTGGVQEHRPVELQECRPYRDAPGINWIDIPSLADVPGLNGLLQHFGVHELVREDIFSTSTRAKFEDYETYLFIVLKTVPRTMADWEFGQLSLIVGRTFVLSLHDGGHAAFRSVRERLRKSNGGLVGEGPDHLAYTLIDAVVDRYYVSLGAIEELLDRLDVEVIAAPHEHLIQEAHRLKGTVLEYRRNIWPTREVIWELREGKSALIGRRTKLYLKDVADHVIEAIDKLEIFRDTLRGINDTYLSISNNRLNQIVTMLSLLAAIFIPLTFIVGIYGMNFKYMPELEWRYGYPAVWGAMLLVSGSLLLYFKRKRWI